MVRLTLVARSGYLSTDNHQFNNSGSTCLLPRIGHRGSGERARAAQREVEGLHTAWVRTKQRTDEKTEWHSRIYQNTKAIPGYLKMQRKGPQGDKQKTNKVGNETE